LYRIKITLKIKMLLRFAAGIEIALVPDRLKAKV
jgi:hypothetical protein